LQPPDSFLFPSDSGLLPFMDRQTLKEFQGRAARPSAVGRNSLPVWPRVSDLPSCKMKKAPQISMVLTEVGVTPPSDATRVWVLLENYNLEN
jgi:hypothetical protein